MNILFEELAPAQRLGGVEAATGGLVAAFSAFGLSVERRDSMSPLPEQWIPDLVHLHGIWSPGLARRWWHWHKLRVPCMVTVHGMLEPWALAHKKWKKQVAWHGYQRLILNRCSLLHATSVREAANLRKLGLKPPIAMIPWGIEGQGTSNVEHRTSNIEHSKRTVLFVGRIYPVKGLPLLVEAWAKIRPVGWKMKIVGPDEAGHLAEVEAMVRRAGLENEFEFTGALERDDLRRVYRSADLLIAPSHTENFGMAIAEAMAHSLPVITTHGAPWKLLDEERCGWWVPVSVDGIAAALEDAMSKGPEELVAMGARGRQVVEERFAWDGVAQEFIKCYRWLLHGGEKPCSVVL
jgi:glycosyltransferase involved in cell wall biosynthesis